MARALTTARSATTRKSVRRGRTPLRIVNPAEEPEVRGDTTLTQEAFANWTAGQRKCRARRRHNWGPYTVWEHRNFLDVVEQCRDCRIRRAADFIKTARGLRQTTKWQPDYRDSNYLLPKGAAPIDIDMRDELVASDILSRKIVEVKDDEEEDVYS